MENEIIYRVTPRIIKELVEDVDYIRYDDCIIDLSNLHKIPYEDFNEMLDIYNTFMLYTTNKEKLEIFQLWSQIPKR